MLRSVVYQKIGIITAHTTMQYGHSAPISYSDWKISQCTNSTPNVTPTCSPIHTHRGNETPASSSTPSVVTTVNPATPSSGFGNPNTSACAVFMIEPQLSTGLMLHVGT